LQEFIIDIIPIVRKTMIVIFRIDFILATD